MAGDSSASWIPLSQVGKCPQDRVNSIPRHATSDADDARLVHDDLPSLTDPLLLRELWAAGTALAACDPRDAESFDWLVARVDHVMAEHAARRRGAAASQPVNQRNVRVRVA
jgi:hypothetical protein